MVLLFVVLMFYFCVCCFINFLGGLEAHVFEDSPKTVVLFKGLTLTAGQTARMNHSVLMRGLGLGHVFVHTITVTDASLNGLVIFLYQCFLVIYLLTLFFIGSVFVFFCFS